MLAAARFIKFNSIINIKPLCYLTDLFLTVSEHENFVSADLDLLRVAPIHTQQYCYVLSCHFFAQLSFFFFYTTELNCLPLLPQAQVLEHSSMLLLRTS